MSRNVCSCSSKTTTSHGRREIRHQQNRCTKSVTTPSRHRSRRSPLLRLFHETLTWQLLAGREAFDGDCVAGTGVPSMLEIRRETCSQRASTRKSLSSQLSYWGLGAQDLPGVREVETGSLR